MADCSREEWPELLYQKTGPFMTLNMPIMQAGSDQHQNTSRLEDCRARQSRR